MSTDDGRTPDGNPVESIGDFFEALGLSADETFTWGSQETPGLTEWLGLKIDDYLRNLPRWGPEEAPGLFEWMGRAIPAGLSWTLDQMPVVKLFQGTAEHLERIGKGDAAAAASRGQQPSWASLVDPETPFRALPADPGGESELRPGREPGPTTGEFRRLLAFGPLIDDLPDKTPGREIKRGQREALLEVARLGHTHAIVQEDGDIVPAPQPGLGRELRGLVDELDDWISAASQPADDRPVQTREYRDPDTGLKRLYTIRLDPVTGRIDVSLPQPDGTDQWVPVHQTNLEDPSAATDPTWHTQEYFKPDGQPVRRTVRVLPDGTREVSLGGQWIAERDSGLSLKKPPSAATDPTRHTQEYFKPDGQPVRRTVRVLPDGTREVSLGGQWIAERDSGLSLEKPPSAATDPTRHTQEYFKPDGQPVRRTVRVLPDGTREVSLGGQWIAERDSGLSLEKPVSAEQLAEKERTDRAVLLSTVVDRVGEHLRIFGQGDTTKLLKAPMALSRLTWRMTTGEFSGADRQPTQEDLLSVFDRVAGLSADDPEARAILVNSWRARYGDHEDALLIDGPTFQSQPGGANVASLSEIIGGAVGAGRLSYDQALAMLNGAAQAGRAMIGPTGYVDHGVDINGLMHEWASAVASGAMKPDHAIRQIQDITASIDTATQRQLELDRQKSADAFQRGQFAFQVDQENWRRQDDLRRERQALTQQAQAQEMDFLNFVLRTAQAGMLPGLTRGVPADLAGARDLAQRAGVTVDTPAAIAGGPLPFPDFRAGMEGAWADWAAAEAAPPLTVEGLQQGGPAP